VVCYTTSAMGQYTFQQGFSYVAAFDKPWIASSGMIKSGVEDQGFRVDAYYKCEKAPNFPFVPPSRARCGKDYDHVAVVTRTARTERIDVPKEVKWIVQVPKAQPSPPPKPPSGTLPQQGPSGPNIASSAQAPNLLKTPGKETPKWVWAAAGGAGIIVLLKLLGK